MRLIRWEERISLEIDNWLEMLSLIADSIAYQLDVELFSGQIDVKSGEK